MKRKILTVFIVLLVLIQFFRIDKTNPPIAKGDEIIMIVEIPKEVYVNLDNACYDCHSFETEYPWYTNIAPLSWWIKSHINGGREHLNFSTWGKYSAEEKLELFEECVEKIEKGEMPLKSFKIAHPEARLNEEQKSKLLNWLKSQFHLDIEDHE